MVFSDDHLTGVPVTELRLFERNGFAQSGTFLVSEKELPIIGTKPSRHPRVAWRNNAIAVAWESGNVSETNSAVVAFRLFSAADLNGSRLSLTRSGNNLTLEWQGPGMLESTTTLSGPWIKALEGASPVHLTLGDTQRFFRIR